MKKMMYNGKALLALAAMVLLASCGEAPTNCECKENLDLVVNHEQKAATTYVGQFNKDIYDTCIDQFKKENNIEGEVLIKAVFKSYEEACIE
jgi:spermidine/putrescine-binding protein